MEIADTDFEKCCRLKCRMEKKLDYFYGKLREYEERKGYCKTEHELELINGSIECLVLRLNRLDRQLYGVNVVFNYLKLNPVYFERKKAGEFDE